MTKLQANLCLLGVTLCWSTEVIIFACIPDDVSPYATTCITSIVGAILLFFLFFSRILRIMREHGREIIARAVLLGVLNFAYNVLYQFGLKDFDVSTGAFTLSLTVVILPIVLLVQKNGVSKRTWLAGGLVLLGIIVSLSGTLHVNQLDGLSLIAIGCVLRSIFIIKLNEYAKQYDPVGLSAIMALAVGIITFLPWVFAQPTTFAAITWSKQTIASLAIYAYFIVVFAQTLNIFAQKRASASTATIIYAMEIVFSVILGALLPSALIDRVPVTAPILIGLILVVLGNIVEVLAPGADREEAGESETNTDTTAHNDHARREVARRLGLAILNMMVCYLMIAIPFKVLSVIPGFTDIRPVMMLGPVYAIFFGVPGCLVMAVGNLIMDIVSDSLRWSCIGGFIANFLGPYLFYLYWTRYVPGRAARKGSTPAGFHLRTGTNLLRCVLIIVIMAVVEAVIITPMVAVVYPDVDAALFALSVLFNTALFPIFFGIPAMMVMQEEIGIHPMSAIRRSTI